MILLCGGTGMLGKRVAHGLAEIGSEYRVLVRKISDASALRALGAETVVGDLRDPTSLAEAVRGADTVISTANSMARVLGGDAKRATETRLAVSSIREVIVQPDMFQEVWLTPLVSFNWPERRFTIFGKGDSAHRYTPTRIQHPSPGSGWRAGSSR